MVRKAGIPTQERGNENKDIKTQSVPSLRFPEFDGEWEGKRLGDISRNVMYGMNSAAIIFDGTNKYIRITDIDEESRAFRPKPLTSPNGKLEDKYKLKNDDIVFTRTGASVGKSYMYQARDGVLYFAGFLIRFSITSANTKFVFQQTLHSPYEKWVLVMSMRSGQPGINAEEYKLLKLHTPEQAEQQKIADFLTAVDKRIEQLEGKKRLLTEYKKGVMQQIFARHIRFTNGTSTSLSAGNGKPYPDWQEKRLGDVASFFSGGTPITTNKSFYDGDIPFIKSGEINALKTKQYLSKSGVDGSSAKLVEVDDLLYALYGATSGEVGISKIKGAINQAVLCIRSQQNIRYLYNFLRFNKVRILNKYLQGGQGNLSADIIKKLIVTFPSIQEQKKIADFLTSIDNKIEQVGAHLAQAKAFKKGLLQQMFV